MKKNLLSVLAFCGMLSMANAQTFTNGSTGFTMDYTGSSANPTCLVNSAPNNGEQATTGGNFDNGVGTANSLIGTTGNFYLELVGVSTISAYATPAFYHLTETYNDPTNGPTCSSMSKVSTGAEGVNMSSNYQVQITAKASSAGATLDIFLGSANNTDYPASSTYNTGAGVNGVNYITKTITLTASYATYTIDYSADPNEKAIFDAWAGNTMVNQIGFRGQNASTNYDITNVTVGSSVLGVSNAILPTDVKYYPNPSSSVINVDNMNVSSLKLMNVNGTVVKEATTSSISVEGLSSGMYFLQINNFKPVKVAVK